MDKVRYMISDAASRIQVESHVLRYWEEELELDVPRNEMGHRYYTEENLRQFERIKRLKEEGYQLKAIKMLIHSLQTDEAEELAEAMRAETQEGRPFCEEKAGDGEGVLCESEKSDKAIPTSAEAPLSKLEQFQLMMNEIVRNAIAENNQALGYQVSTQVGERVLKEMNYLMREREEQEEERFRKLDEAIRTRQRKTRREKAAKRKEKANKVRLRTRESIS